MSPISEWGKASNDVENLGNDSVSGIDIISGAAQDDFIYAGSGLVDLSFAAQSIKELGEWKGPICPSEG